jgi:hypothetical protein
MKYLINGIVDIIKLIIVLGVIVYAFESGIVSDIINMIK